MNILLYTTGQLIIIVLVIGLINSILFAVKHAGVKLEWSESKQRNTKTILITIAAAWLTLLSFASWSGFFSDFSVFPPRILFVFIPPLILTLFLLFWPDFWKLLKQVPKSWLIYIQVFRVIMELFLWMGFRAGYVPPQMTFEWFNHDIIVGITAPMAGFSFFGKRRYHRYQAVLWNCFGLALLANIVMVAILSVPSPLRVFMNEPANIFVTAVPFIWIPGFIVPFALAMHLFSLKQLLMRS